MKVFAVIQAAAMAAVASAAGCEVDILGTTAAIASAAAQMKNASFNCGQNGTPANCRADVANIETSLSTASTHLQSADTDCADAPATCAPALQNLTATIATANKDISNTGKACAFHGDPLCAIALVESSLSIAAGVVEGATCLSDCKASVKCL